jgi:glutathione S-transferase
MEYLDEVAGDVCRFTPEDPLERARMRTMMRYIDEIPTPAVRVPSYNLAFLPHFQEMTEEAFIALANSKPLRKEFLLSMGRTGFPQKEMDQAIDRLNRAVVRMDLWIAESGGPWLMGKTLTLADIAVMPVIVRMDDINLDGAWSDRPAIANWLAMIKAHEAYETTFYPGSLLTEKYPHLAVLREKKVTA